MLHILTLSRPFLQKFIIYLPIHLLAAVHPSIHPSIHLYFYKNILIMTSWMSKVVFYCRKQRISLFYSRHWRWMHKTPPKSRCIKKWTLCHISADNFLLTAARYKRKTTIRFEVYMAVVMKTFAGTCFIRLQGRRVSSMRRNSTICEEGRKRRPYRHVPVF
jgi:hypothetical protein